MIWTSFHFDFTRPSFGECFMCDVPKGSLPGPSDCSLFPRAFLCVHSAVCGHFGPRICGGKSMGINKLCYLVVISVALALPKLVPAQVAGGTISGTISDTAGLLIPSARIPMFFGWV